MNKKWDWYESKYHLAEIIIPILEAYKKEYNLEGRSIPSWLLDKEKKTLTNHEIEKLQKHWNEELDKMILAFKQILNYKISFDSNLGYDENKIQDGLNLFSKYFMHLWD